MRSSKLVLSMLMVAAIAALCAWRANPSASPKKSGAVSRYNVLFLFVDDLRPELGCYGQKYIHSPNIDSLAQFATVFNQQYVSVPTCGASRASLLSGLRPHSSLETANEVFESRQAGKLATSNPESFIANFKNNGYYTVGIGKISHSPDGYIYPYLQPRSNRMELPASWDEMLFDAGKWKTGWNAFFGYVTGNNRNEVKGQVKPYEAATVEDDGYPDGLTANLAIKKLQELAGSNKPFFLGVGFFKPHLPFNAPQKYWDLYKEDELPLTPSPGIPALVNKASLNRSDEFNGYKLGDEKASLSAPVSDAYARKLRHAYFASVSYADALVGKVLIELKRLHLDKNTIVVLWGDHGWHLGDDLVWGKHTLSEWATHSPLIIKMPGQRYGIQCNRVISSIDVYPTLMDLCGLKMPYVTEGRSLVPLLKRQPMVCQEAAYSYFNHGITLRTSRYRLTRYFRSAQPDVELYDHQTDPYENVNIATTQPQVVQQLLQLWKKGNTHLYDHDNTLENDKSDQ